MTESTTRVYLHYFLAYFYPLYYLAYLPRVREYKDVIRTDAEDQEKAGHLEDAHGFLGI